MAWIRRVFTLSKWPNVFSSIIVSNIETAQMADIGKFNK